MPVCIMKRVIHAFYASEHHTGASNIQSSKLFQPFLHIPTLLGGLVNADTVDAANSFLVRFIR
jgi:hypothetical protein